MYRNGRPEDQVFDGAELLCRRYVQEHLINGQFSPAGFSFKTSGPSVNRQKYSDPEDVLFLPDGTFCDECGVLEFAVWNIPARIQGGQSAYVFSPRHVPEDLNYAHSEIWCDSEEPTGGCVEPTRAVKKKLRAILGQHAFPRIAACK
jgi:hypothetical protein